MVQLSIMIRELTDELNNIDEEIENYKNYDDKIMMLFRTGVVLADISKYLKGILVARYDTENKKPYLLYPDGTRK